MKAIISTLALFCFAGTAYAGPFGTHMGMQKSEFKDLKEVNAVTYLSYEVPKPSPLFSSYGLDFGSEGLCAVVALGKSIDTNGHGTSLKAQFEELEEALSKKYGVHSRKIDHLVSGSIWNEPQDWMMAHVKNDRILNTNWNSENRPALPDALIEISLTATASDTSTGYVSLTYTYENAKSCEDVLKKADFDNL